MRRFTIFAAALLVALAATASSTADAPGPPVTDPGGVINLPAGYSYTILSTDCEPAQSTESGAEVVTPADPDANVLFSAGKESWLLTNRELTKPVAGDFQGDAGKCHVDEQTPGDGDSDGWGAVTRLVLAKDGTTVLRREVITTGLHDNCAGAQTPWKTYLTNEEFPFLSDPDQRSGWVWEIDPATGAQKRLTGMGRFSHEQEAYAAGGSWYMTDDRGNYQYLYKFVPDRRSDLTAGKLYGLHFDRATNTGTWVGPLNPFDPENDMVARVGAPNASNSFAKAEGIVGTASSATRGGNAVVFSESGFNTATTTDPGRVWRLTDLSHDVVKGEVLVEGDFGRLSRPDNLRFNDAGDLFIMEDHGSSEFALAGGSNDVWVLPRGEVGAENLVLFATLPSRGEPTGPWFSNDNKLLYLSVQREGTPSHVIAIRHPANFNQPYDR
jgi:secreted PhoX family phosphatase